MLTAEDANAHHDVHPNRQAVWFSDILVTLPLSATVVRETPRRMLGHVVSSQQFEETHSLSAVQAAPSLIRWIQTF